MTVGHNHDVRHPVGHDRKDDRAKGGSQGIGPRQRGEFCRVAPHFTPRSRRDRSPKLLEEAGRHVRPEDERPREGRDRVVGRQDPGQIRIDPEKDGNSIKVQRERHA